MNRSDALAVIRQIYGIEISSFLRYLIEVSFPPVHVHEADEKAFTLCRELYNEQDEAVRVMGQFLADADEVPDAARWPMTYTNFNFLQPRYLLRPLLERQRRQVEEVENHAARLAAVDWPELDELLKMVRDRDAELIRKLTEAVESCPEPDVHPGEKKGTSASRW